jgi:hypothetical protein
MLKITSPDGNTTEEEFSPAEMAEWFSRGDRAELELTGKLRQLVGLRGVRIIQVVPSQAPTAGNTQSRLGGLYHLMVTETNGAEYVTRYGEDEMAELFSAAQRHDLAKAGVLVVGNCRFVDMVAAARTIRD